MAFQPAAALEAPATLTVPEIRRLFLVVNTDAAHAITVARGAASVVVASGATAVLCTDGTPDGLFAAGGAAQSQLAVYDFGMKQWETPAPGAVMGKVVIPRALTIAADFAGSHGHVDTAPATAGWSLSVTLNGTAIGTVTIDGTGAFAFATTNAAPVAVAAGDVIRFVASSANDPAEASLAGLALTIAAELV